MARMILWLALERGFNGVGHLVDAVVRSGIGSPDGGGAIGISLLLIVGVAVFAARTLSPGPGRWSVTLPPRRGVDPVDLHPLPVRSRERYSPPPPKRFPARAYQAAHKALLLGTAPSPTSRLLDETGLMPMAHWKWGGVASSPPPLAGGGLPGPGPAPKGRGHPRSPAG